MQSSFPKIWHRLFLEERPSICLSFFRMAVAFTVGAHVIPSFFHMPDNYLGTAYKTWNASFFPVEFIQWINGSPEWLIYLMVAVFLVSNAMFFIGWFSQLSAIVLMASCYYFYALNAFHVGTLSWDILLVTLFLMCLTPYHGDYFSVDALRRRDPDAYKTPRPYFLQRMLQIQIAFTYFYTSLVKVGGYGNWLRDNPIYSIMHYPPPGTTKWFLLRDFLANHPQLCYTLGIGVIVCEFAMLFLLFYPKTRISAIYLGIVFHVTLILTLDVPATFFFLFPPQLLLFIDPRRIVAWIETKQRQLASAGVREKIIYDGQCHFCRIFIERLKVMDLFRRLDTLDLHALDFESFPWPVARSAAISQIHMIDLNGRVWGGFSVIQHLSTRLPMLWPAMFIVYFPGMGIAGPLFYRWVARNRFFFHRSRVCRDNACLS